MRKTHLIGLTGSIGMGKSTVSAMFAANGVAVWDADAAVHALYAADMPGCKAISKICPGAVNGAGVDRAALSLAIRQDPSLLKRIEAAIHPLVAQHRAEFITAHSDRDVLCDIPLLFENNSQSDFDWVVVVSAPVDVQLARVMARPGMTREKFEFILSRQIPDAEKRNRADFVIENGGTLVDTERQVRDILSTIRAQDR